MYKLFGMSISGNCYKVKLLLEQLPAQYQWEETDILKGETNTPEFLAVNPSGQLPALEIGPGQYLAESNAILCYLADGTAFLPHERFERAQTLRWMFFEQNSHELYIAGARFICTFLPGDHQRRTELPRLHERGYQALALMEQHLAQRLFFVKDTYSIADISLFAYTHMAADGGFDLARFPAINAWIERVKAQPRFVPMG